MSGLDEKLYTAEQVRRLDACAINEHGIDGYELMERAGRAVFDLVLKRFSNASHWTVVCGGGNNGGDGYVIARLAAAAGKHVNLIAVKQPGDMNGDALRAVQDWLETGGSVKSRSDHDAEFEPELLIDALFGTGLDRPVAGEYKAILKWMNAQDCPGIAVDIPSGLNADTGQVMGIAFQADCTMSFIGRKRGLLTCDGPDYAGELFFDSLGVPDVVFSSVTDSGQTIRENLLIELLPHRERNSHKGSFGHVLVVGGCSGMSGAVLLAGEAALRTGSGLVSIATHPDHAGGLNLARPELMVSGIKQPDDLQPLLDRSSVIAFGPGLGNSDWSRQLLLACLEGDKPLIVDADGLNRLAESPVERSAWILTPHPAEAGRLLQSSAERVQADRVESARSLAVQYGAIIVLKGCGTVLAHPDGRYAICPLGNPGMATAGSGDALTGIIASLTGQGLDPWQAAQSGVVLHAAAGDHAAAQWGERGMLAGDLIDNIPAVPV